MVCKNILITGGLGFIGSNFLYYLTDNFRDKVNKIINFDLKAHSSDINNLKDQTADFFNPQNLFQISF